LLGYNNIRIKDFVLHSGPCVVDSVSVIIQNLGQNSLTSADIVVSIDGLATDTVSYNGNLISYQFDTIVMQLNYQSVGTVQFDIDAYNPNGYSDDDPSNNNASNNLSVFDFSNVNELILEFPVSYYGVNVSWNIVDESNYVVLSGNTYYNQYGTSNESIYTHF